MPGSGLKLPLDLAHIASRCRSAYYAPRRFAVRFTFEPFYRFPKRSPAAQAVQLAYSSPRSRVLVFRAPRRFEPASFGGSPGVCLADTGRLVGTGTSSAMEARVAICRAQRQLAVEAGVVLHVRNFQVINTVRVREFD